MVVTDEGMQIDCNDEHKQKVPLSRAESSQPGSNVKTRSLALQRKQASEMVSIDDGIQIDRSEEQREKAYSPKIDSLEPDSNATIESLVHPSKQRLQIVSIDEGTQMRSRENSAGENSADAVRIENWTTRPSRQREALGKSCW
jgi:hypothetical protein